MSKIEICVKDIGLGCKYYLVTTPITGLFRNYHLQYDFAKSQHALWITLSA